MRCAVAIGLLLLASSAAGAPAPKVTIRGVSGEITVTGSASARQVTGSGRIERDGDEVEVRGSMPQDDLVVTVPAGAEVTAKTASGRIRVTGVKGSVTCKTANGDVTVEGAGRGKVTVKSVSGRVRVSGASGELVIKTVSGDVKALGRPTAVKITSVSGKVELDRLTGKGGVVKTTSGRVSLRGALAADGRVKVRSHSGHVSVSLAVPQGARYDLRSFSGSVALARTAKGAPASLGSRAEGSVGKGRARIKLATFSGNITLRLRP